MYVCLREGWHVDWCVILMVGGWRSRTRILCKRRTWKEELGEGAERRSWKVGVPAWGFSAKDDKQQKTDSGAQSKQNKPTHRSAATSVFFFAKRMWLQNGAFFCFACFAPPNRFFVVYHIVAENPQAGTPTWNAIMMCHRIVVLLCFYSFAENP